MIKKFTMLAAFAALALPAFSALVVTADGEPVTDGQVLNLDCIVYEENWGDDADPSIFTEYKWDPELYATGSGSGSVTVTAVNKGWQLCWPMNCQMIPAGQSAVGNGTFTSTPSNLQIHCAFQGYDNEVPELPEVISATVVVTNGDESITVTLNCHQPNAVASVGSDIEALPEYYTLQGVRVAAPEKGIYIVKRGSKVSKTVIR